MSAPALCNGLANLCSVPVNDVNFGMVHNAMAAVANGFTVAANHFEDPIIEALDAGYRGLSLDICKCDGGQLQFCHGNQVVGCGIGRLDPVAAFTEIEAWIQANPDNVLLISLQINDFNGGVTLEEVNRLIQEELPESFATRLYDHWPLDASNQKEWPTMGELIESGQQVLLFYFAGPNPNPNDPHLTGLNQWWSFVEATNFSWERASDISSTLVPNCPTTRGKESTGDFFLIEAFVTETLFGIQFQPSRDAAQIINTVDFATPILDACSDVHLKEAQIYSVDFWSEGNFLSAINARNSQILVDGPTSLPTSSLPTNQPTRIPSQEPTSSPSKAPTTSPSRIPSIAPQPQPQQQTLDPTATASAIPTFERTSSTTFSPSEEDFSGTNLTESSSMPSMSPSVDVSQRPSQVNDTIREDVCEIELADGETVTIPHGESYGPFFASQCGSTDEFPCFCNTELPGKIECPYCKFEATKGDEITFYCAKNEEMISFLDGNLNKTCSCQILEDPLAAPIQSCVESVLEEDSSSSPTSLPTFAPTTNNNGATTRAPVSIAAIQETSGTVTFATFSALAPLFLVLPSLF